MHRVSRILDIVADPSWADAVKFHGEEIKAKAIEGTRMHKLASEVLFGAVNASKMDDADLDFVRAYQEWMHEEVREVVYAESRLESKKHDYSGRPDLVYIDKQGLLCLVDNKFTCGVSKRSMLQLAAYNRLLPKPAERVAIQRYERTGKDKKWRIVSTQVTRGDMLYYDSLWWCAFNLFKFFIGEEK